MGLPPASDLSPFNPHAISHEHLTSTKGVACQPQHHLSPRPTHSTAWPGSFATPLGGASATPLGHGTTTLFRLLLLVDCTVVRRAVLGLQGHRMSIQTITHITNVCRAALGLCAACDQGGGRHPQTSIKNM